MLQPELELALQAARHAGAIQMEHFGIPLRKHLKQDSSPVTGVDTLCEESIRTLIFSRFPQDGYLGEELGAIEGTSGRRWIVDPLDGTRPFLHGIPTFSVLIALEIDSFPCLGVMGFPALKETYHAVRGGGAFCNDESISVSQTHTEREVFGSALGFIEKAETPEGQCLFTCMRSWDYAYGFMDAYSYAACAAGKLDVCVNLLDKPWDCAAAACIVREAGGRFTDIKARESIYNGSVVVSNATMHDTILRYFKDV